MRLHSREPSTPARSAVPSTPALPRRSESAVTNILVGLFAILLCVVNAVVWTLVSEMPFMGVAWLGAAFGCIWLQKWSRN
jgi:hypothetical protein